ncbi:unnamed protein product [Mycena citricolor]|uniref:Uncharacterized protein n=1 Tax=Mycena citricolor TaxID=2018698 RepID=A0AAD2HL88_9AGAR|nr:unnamed protein product [Mycena citricolor]
MQSVKGCRETLYPPCLSGQARLQCQPREMVHQHRRSFVANGSPKSDSGLQARDRRRALSRR